MNNYDISNEPSYKQLLWLLLVVVAIWGSSGLILHKWVKDSGSFGDMFGAVNALFSGLAFATLIYTVNLQRTELKLQRKELTLTREELKGQKEQLAAQNDLLRSDAFENTFFQVLRAFTDLTNSIDIHHSGEASIVGRDCFNNFYRHLRVSYTRIKRANPSVSEPELILQAYSNFYDKFHGDVGHYFRTLYNLIKLVDRSDATDKRFYTNLVRAQLSSQELLLLFYNCQTNLGSEKFYPLIEKYTLFKTLPIEKLLDPAHIELCSPRSRGEG
jgi:hypothetical protein